MPISTYSIKSTR